MKKHIRPLAGKVKIPKYIHVASLCIACFSSIWSLVYYLSTSTDDTVVNVLSAAIIGILAFITVDIPLIAIWKIYDVARELISPKKKDDTQEVIVDTPTPSSPSAPSESLFPAVQMTSTPPKCRLNYSAMVPANGKTLQSVGTYVVLDTETTGLSTERDRIVEISLGRYEKGVRLDHYSTLVNPCIPISPAASRINHITDADVSDAPEFLDIWPRVRKFFDGSVVIGHNVTFDLGMIGHAMPPDADPVDMTYLDTVKLAKLAFPGQPSYKLVNLVQSLGIAESQDHRAESDVELTAQLFECCRYKIVTDYKNELADRRAKREQQKAEKQAAFSWSPLLDKNFVFTGEFQHDRAKLEEILKTVGANLRDKVNGNTDYLVVGELKNLPQWAVDRKHGKAKELAVAGKKVQIIDEKKYLSLIHETTKLMQE